jgi:hypothetical protein
MSVLITTLLFSAISAAVVYLAGCRDAARDPRLTGWALVLMLIHPIAALGLPKWIHVGAPSGSQGSLAAMAGDVGWHGVWMAGSLILAARLGLAGVVIHSWRRHSLLLGRRGRVEIRMSPRVHGPVATGVFRPVVYVPVAWRMWSDETRRIVVDHEMAHHARRDPMLRWMAEFACAVNWFNPVVWWMARRFVMQCEFACDAEVIASGVGKSRYVGVLCDLAVVDSDAGPIAAMAVRSTLEKRVIRLASIRDRGGIAGFSGSRCWLLGGVLALAGTALAMVGPSPVQQSLVPASEVQIRWSANPFPAEPR